MKLEDEAEASASAARQCVVIPVRSTNLPQFPPPDVGASSSPMVFSRVLLPEPDGPDQRADGSGDGDSQAGCHAGSRASTAVPML